MKLKQEKPPETRQLTPQYGKKYIKFPITDLKDSEMYIVRFTGYTEKFVNFLHGQIAEMFRTQCTLGTMVKEIRKIAP